jgi:hypothetical protein
MGFDLRIGTLVNFLTIVTPKVNVSIAFTIFNIFVTYRQRRAFSSDTQVPKEKVAVVSINLQTHIKSSKIKHTVSAQQNQTKPNTQFE